MIKAILIKANGASTEKLITEVANDTGFIEIEQVLKVSDVNFKNLKNINCDLLIIEANGSTPVATQEKLMKAGKKIFSKPHTIHISSSASLAAQAFDCGFDDFIVAPLKRHRLLLSFRRIHERFLYRLGKQEGSESRYFFVKEKNELTKIEADNILYIQAMGDYIVVHTTEAKFTIHSTIKSMETRLPRSNYARIHRSYLINLDRIVKIIDDQVFVNDVKLPIGEAFRSELLQRLTVLK